MFIGRHVRSTRASARFQTQSLNLGVELVQILILISRRYFKPIIDQPCRLRPAEKLRLETFVPIPRFKPCSSWDLVTIERERERAQVHNTRKTLSSDWSNLWNLTCVLDNDTYEKTFLFNNLGNLVNWLVVNFFWWNFLFNLFLLL